MKLYNEIILDAGDASGDLESNPAQIGSYLGYTIQAVITGDDALGVAKLQGSIDVGENIPLSPVFGQGVTNWEDITKSSYPVTGSGQIVWNVGRSYYKWVRIVFTATGGSTGSITARIEPKGY